MKVSKRGFTLVEILISLSIIGLLSVLSAAMILPARAKARDTARMAALNGLGRYLWASQCHVPAQGAGDYDLQEIYTEYVAANPAAAAFLAKAPRDPKTGTATTAGYRYAFSSDGACAAYANLENDKAEVSLPAIFIPTPGGGTGTFMAAAAGANGSRIFYQVSR